MPHRAKDLVGNAEKTCKKCTHKVVCSIWGLAKRFLMKQADDSLLNSILPSDNDFTEAIAKSQIATACLCVHYKLDESSQ